MKTPITLIAAVCLVAAALAQQSSPPPVAAQTGDKTSIASPPAAAATNTNASVLRMLDDYLAAVNARDPARFLEFFEPTEDLTVFEDKDLRLSRKEFVAFVNGFFKDVSQIQATWEQRAVHELAPNVAVVTGTFKVGGKDAKGAPMAFRNAFTFVLVKPGERWLVKHVHESTLTTEPAPTATTSDEVAMEAAIRDADAAWAKAIASKSIDQTLAFYDPESVTAGSAMFLARGLPAFRENWAKLFDRPDFALAWKADRVVVTASATIAYSAGTWSMPGPDANGPYLAVWRKQPDGQWKVLIDAAWRAVPMSRSPAGTGANVGPGSANRPSTQAALLRPAVVTHDPSGPPVTVGHSGHLQSATSFTKTTVHENAGSDSIRSCRGAAVRRRPGPCSNDLLLD